MKQTIIYVGLDVDDISSTRGRSRTLLLARRRELA